MTLSVRNDVFWWIYVAALAAAAVFIGHSFVGVLVLGLFGYYATRPICNRFTAAFGSKRLAAGATALAVLLPIVLLSLYAGVRMVQQIRRQFDETVFSMLGSRVSGVDIEGDGPGSLLRDPPSIDQLTDLLFGSALQQGLNVLDALFGTILLLSLAVTLSYALLVHDEALSGVFAELVGGPDETVYSYTKAVDVDLQSIFFGNFLFALMMSVIAMAAYAITNLVAPPGARIPMVFTLGVLTGFASLIPIIVGKVVYVPVVAYLAVATTRGGDGQYVFVGAVLVAYVLVLDILPQSVIQPYISGQKLDPIILLFAYILGPILFGWYGFFLLPIVFVLMLEAARIVLPELLHGDPVESDPELAEGTGADVDEIQEDDADTASSDSDTTSTDEQ
ncbi:AI-2E family transporter [Halobaculum sp. WSA2]|uniref:AI-2E family transporter n=1 Tax=Halobaculum saliterrae TaxID=2073113 RepID=A0A6B0SNP2_9EURY|nr:AI-2E family transporter [Halobaculum saliterrae]MXR40538.1 AI-2E family transporter [Halobaculum saliterrae]